MPYARIAITLPPNVLAAVDKRARAEGRPRSRVIVDALRSYLAAPAAVREPPVPAYGTDPVGTARREQLERDLARTPAERLLSGEHARRAKLATRSSASIRMRSSTSGKKPIAHNPGLRRAESRESPLPGDRRGRVHPTRLCARHRGYRYPDRAHRGERASRAQRPGPGGIRLCTRMDANRGAEEANHRHRR